MKPEQAISGITGHDFSSSLPALLVKELRQGLREKVFVVAMIALPITIAIPFILACIRDPYGAPLVGREAVEVVFWLVAVVFLLAAYPLKALGAVNREQAGKSHEILVLTQLSAGRIVFQKWLSLMLQELLLMCLLFPFLILRYFLGGVELFDSLLILAWFVVQAGISIAICLWISGMPLIMRVFFIIGCFVLLISSLGSGASFIFMKLTMGGMGGGLFASSSSGVEAWAMVLSIYLGAIPAIPCFLWLAAKSFAPLSENLSAPLRKILLAVLLVSSVVMGIILLCDAAIKYYAFAWLGVVAWVFLSMFILETVLPGKMLPVHVEKLKKGGTLNRLLTLILLPGWQSAALFGLVGGFLCAWPFLMSFATNAIPELGDRSWFVLIKPFLAFWGSILGLVFVCFKLFEKTKYYSLLIFGIIVGFLSLVAAILTAADQADFIGLIPFCSVTAAIMEWQNTASQQLVSPWGVNLFLVCSVLIYAMLSSPYWEGYRCYSKAVRNIPQQGSDK